MSKPFKSWMSKLQGSEFKVMRLGECVPSNNVVLDNPEYVVRYLRENLSTSLAYKPDVENAIAIYLNVKRRPIGFEVVSNGSIDTLFVDVRTLFRGAIIANAHAVIMAHNHPSGSASPSEADIKVTRNLITAGTLLRIELLDHIILGQPGVDSQKGYISLRELGYFAA